MTRRMAPLLAIAAVALVATTVVFAGDGMEQVRLNPVDQAAARAVLIRRADLGSTGWQGGRVKPDLSAGPTCPNYHP
jgi:hypothetical protein